MASAVVARDLELSVEHLGPAAGAGVEAVIHAMTRYYRAMEVEGIHRVTTKQAQENVIKTTYGPNWRDIERDGIGLG